MRARLSLISLSHFIYLSQQHWAVINKMVGSAKSEQQKLPQQYLPFVLGTSETALNSSITNNQGHQPLQQPQSLQQPKQAPTKWYDSLIFDRKEKKRPRNRFILESLLQRLYSLFFFAKVFIFSHCSCVISIISRTAATTVAETTMTASAVGTKTTTSTTTTSTSSAQEQTKTSKASITTQASSLVSPTPISLNSTNSSITSALQQSHRSIITSSQMKCKIFLFNQKLFCHSFDVIWFLLFVLMWFFQWIWIFCGKFPIYCSN